MRKILASDLDGTLVSNNTLTKENRQAILKLKENDHIFVVSTGRPLNGVVFLKEEEKLDIDYYVLLNGAFVLDKELNVLIHKDIPYEIVNEICEKYTDSKVGLSIETGYTTNVIRGDNLCYDSKTDITSLDDIRSEKLSLISMYYKDRDLNEIDNMCREINEKYGHVVVAYRNDIYIDVVPVGCSKGNGIEEVCDREGIKMNHVYTIGDSWNDVTMFNITRNSFTFKDVEEDLKGKANNIVSSVAECVEDYIL